MKEWDKKDRKKEWKKEIIENRDRMREKEG
jgi:hypothetical protein